jgi:tetratricopeptide (TPR) repeat protein
LSLAQNKKTDSLLTALKTAKEDTNKVNVLNSLFTNYIERKLDSAFLFANSAHDLAEKIKWQKGKIDALMNLSFYLRKKGDFQLALKNLSIAEEMAKQEKDEIRLGKILGHIGSVHLELVEYEKAKSCFQKALVLYEKNNYKSGIGKIYTNIGIIYKDKSNYVKALEYYFNALKIDDELGNKSGSATTLGNIGNVYKEQKDYDNALTYMQKALKMDEEAGNDAKISRHLSNIGIVYKSKGDFKTALEYYFKSLKLDEEFKNKQGIVRNLTNIGVVYKNTQDHENAIKYYSEALKLNSTTSDKKTKAAILGNLGGTYMETAKYDLGEKYLIEAVELSNQLGLLLYLREFEFILFELYEKKGNYSLAFKHYKQHIAISDSVNNAENTKKQTQLEMQYEFDKKETAAKAEQEVKDQKEAADKKQQQIILFSVSGVLLLVIAFAFFVFRNLRVTQKQKLIIEQQKQVVETQKQIVEEKQKEILDSIRYAKRIQNSLLPTDKYIERSLKELNN